MFKHLNHIMLASKQTHTHTQKGGGGVIKLLPENKTVDNVINVTFDIQESLQIKTCSEFIDT